MQEAIIEKVKRSQLKKAIPRFSVGDKVSVSVRLKEGDKERTQIFRGVIIYRSSKMAKDPGASFTVRKVSSGIGVERTFPIHSPFVEKVVVEGSSQVRRSRLFFLRALKGKKARLKERERGRFEELVMPEVEPEPAVPAVPAEEVVEGAAEAATEQASPQTEGKTEEVASAEPAKQEPAEQQAKETPAKEEPKAQATDEKQPADKPKEEKKE